MVVMYCTTFYRTVLYFIIIINSFLVLSGTLSYVSLHFAGLNVVVK
jgi:hypothetical protein